MWEGVGKGVCCGGQGREECNVGKEIWERPGVRYVEGDQIGERESEGAYEGRESGSSTASNLNQQAQYIYIHIDTLHLNIDEVFSLLNGIHVGMEDGLFSWHTS